MKILAIRGENLASLPEFHLEFEHDPLADAGLFAICGPTGAGKSTLLDALCVALFDKTPRLSVRGGVPVGHPEQDEKERIPANDVRGLLRRGAIEGFAEVDFLGRDDKRYRARWHVRRARRKPQGRIQPQQLSLVELDTGVDLSGTKTETLGHIEDRLGLDFEQFRRSAFLAQGEFAAFLRADSGARGELLERMTGTAIYSELSRAAFEQNKVEIEALRRLEGDVERQPVLAPDERAALDEEHARVESEIVRLDGEIQDAERAVAWHERAHELERVAASARDTLERAERTHAAAAVRRHELERIARARDNRLLLASLDRQRQRSCHAFEALVACQRDERECARVYTDDERAYVQARDQERRARERQRALQPEMERARALDEEIASARDQAETQRRRLDEARLELRQSSDECARLAQRATCLAATIDAAETWLAAHDWADALAGEWPRWNHDLQRYTELAENRQTCERRLKERDAARTRAAEALAGSEAEYESALAARDNARALADSAREAADALSLGDTRERRDLMSRHMEALRGLASTAEAARAARLEETRCRDQAMTLRASRAQAEAEARRVGDEVQQTEIRLAEAEATFERIRTTVALSAHRPQLRPGEPCPLCGATEHPHAREPSPEDRVVEEQRVHVNGLRAHRDALREERARAVDRAARDGERADELSERAEERAKEREHAGHRWREQLANLGELALVHDPADERAGDAVASRLAAAERELGQLRQLEADAIERQARATRARNLADTRQSDLDLAARLREEHAQARRAAEQDWRDARDEYARTERAMRDIVASFTQALASDDGASPTGVLHAWAKHELGAIDAIRAIHQDLRRTMDEREERRAALTDARAAAERVHERLSEYRSLEERHGHRVADLEAAFERHQDQLRAHEEARGALLDGRALGQVTAEHQREGERLADRLEEARERFARSRERAAVAAEKLRTCRRDHARAEEETDAARQALDHALARIAMSEDAVRAYCALDEAEVDERTHALNQIQRRLEEARTIAAERDAQRAAHGASGAPVLDRENARERALSAREARDAHFARRSELALRLRVDDEARAARAHMAAEVARQTKRAEVYGNLSQLIGSADGKKFRVFAQSLTLDALLCYGNHHLQDLADRYRIVRVPGHDLDLQIIDRHMGDEVRSINSLSGGESFLVSLALALGLSSLAARDTRVESLLIDEGFGTLDPSTLDAALSALDALQATGRQVGLISHVPGLAERVGVRVMVQPRGNGRSVVRVSER